MPIDAFARQNCSIARSMAVLGERWTILVLRELLLGYRRFEEIQRHLGIATNVLTDRLGTLVDEGIAERRRYSERPERFEYVLTQKGVDLQPVIISLMQWGDKYTAEHGPPRVLVHTACGHETTAVQVCAHCGEPLDPRETRTRPGPGADELQLAAGERP